MEYKITYSNRKTIAIYVHTDATVEIKCPKRTSRKLIEEMVIKKQKWISNSINKMKKRKQKEFTDIERVEFIEKAQMIIPKRVEHFSKIMGVKPTSIKIGNAKTYWGCCSGKNRLTFPWRLMQASDKVIDYVVVHELAHIKEHNHSKQFWDEVESVLPNYRELVYKLKELN